MEKFEYYLEMVKKENKKYENKAIKRIKNFPIYSSLKEKYKENVANLLILQKEIRNWFFNHKDYENNTENLMGSYKYRSYINEWEYFYNKAISDKDNWKKYVTKEKISDRYDFGDVIS